MIVGTTIPRRAKALRGARPARSNPPAVVRTQRDERLWEVAKMRAEDQISRSRMPPTDYYAYVMGIYQRMKTGDLAKDVEKLKKSRSKAKARRNPAPTAEQQARQDIQTALKGSGFVVDNSGKSGEYADVQLSSGLIVAVCVKPAVRKNPNKVNKKKSSKKKSSKKAKRA